MFLILQKIRQLIANMSRRNVLIMVIIGIATVFIFAVTVFLFEKGKNDDFQSIGDALWWVVVTFTTIGYGDKVPITVGGQITATIGMLVGVGILASILGIIANYIFNFLNRRRKGMQNINSTNHILICGWNVEEGINVVKEISSDSPNKSIVIIANLEEHPAMDFHHVSFIKGSATNKKILEKANADKCSTALIFADNSLDPSSDGKTVLAVMNLKSINPKISICSELVDENNEDYLKKAGCDSVIDITRFGSNMMVQSIQDPGISNVVSRLVSNRIGNTFYRIPLPADYTNKTFKETQSGLDNIIVTGYERNGEQKINPPKNEVLKNGDYLFVIATERPKL